MDRDGFRNRLVFMTGLIVAGETVYALPFHVTRFFRSTVLEVFGITATELGAAQAIYGITAMIAYFPGGPLADRFSARKLLAFSLWSTAAGGFYMATFPGYVGSAWVWGFFGVTTILLFWAALIRATRDWGGADSQGRAYGILDGGRGLLQAGLASVGVLVFALAFPDGYDVASMDDKRDALGLVIHGYTVVTFLTGIFVWFAIPDTDPVTGQRENRDLAAIWNGIMTVVRIPAVWLQATVLLSAYVVFKGFDNYSLFAVEAYGVDEVEAAQIATLGAWIRPIAALAAGFIGDRVGISRTIGICFAVALVTQLLFGFVSPSVAGLVFLLGNIFVACAAFFGLRGLYFALFEESSVPPHVTGTAVGIVSVIGYTPDIFVAYVAGLMIDANPGALGHQHFFLCLSVFAAPALSASFIIVRTTKRTVQR